MELVRNWQGTRVILLVRQFQVSLDAELLCSKCWPNLYCASHVILLQHRTPSHSYGIVTGMFPEPNIYAFVPHIFCIYIFPKSS